MNRRGFRTKAQVKTLIIDKSIHRIIDNIIAALHHPPNEIKEDGQET